MKLEKIPNRAPWERVILDEGEVVKGYKAFKADMTCHGDYQYAVGERYHQEGEILPCKNGFHFCLNIVDCFAYYEPDSIIAEIEARGVIIKDSTKLCASDIRILRVVELDDLYADSSCNSGNCNSGYSNSGDRNSGNYNTGEHNSGHSNSGHHNSGSCNSGHHNSGSCNSGGHNSGGYNSGAWNSGKYNSGNRNTGGCNSGHHNSGNYNSGYGNTCNQSSGIFCQITPKINIFDKPSDWTFQDFYNSEAYAVCGALLSGDKEINELNADDWVKLEQLPNYDKQLFIEIIGKLKEGNK